MSDKKAALPAVKLEPRTLENSNAEGASLPLQPSKHVVLADLNVDPPFSDGDDSLPNSVPDITRLINDDHSQDKSAVIFKESDTLEGEGKKLNKIGKCRTRINKIECLLDYGGDAELEQHGQGTPSSREEKISSLKTNLVKYVTAIRTWQTSGTEILLRPETEIDRPELLSLIQIHHAQCILWESSGDNSSDKELEPNELEEIIAKLKESMQSDIRQAVVWNTLGLILLKSGRLQSAISLLSSLLAIVPDNYDCLGNLGIAYLQRGDLDDSAKCFQELVLKDQNHPAALVNYAALLLCKYGCSVAGAGANAGKSGFVDQATAVNVAKESLLAALKAEPKASHIWVNLSDAFYMAGDYRSSCKCLEKAAKLDSNCLSTRYAVALHRVKDAERSQDPTEQLNWAGNEMASIIRDGDYSSIEVPLAWTGLALVHKIQHEITAAFANKQTDTMDLEERANYSLKQTIVEDPDDALHWHQLGLHSLCSRKFSESQKYFKAAVARFKECSCAWSNLGISLQLSEESSQAEVVFKQALALAGPKYAHAVFSNLGNLCRQQKQYERAKAMFSKSLELQPGYAPAFNNLGLVFVAEGRLEEAKYCFDQALQSDPLLDAAKSNSIKVAALSRLP
ncbi:hypothetical protein SAY87_003019 [Trapa incisa]|uniref:UDP-N-acetylglucosamine--peptide N-acetylglucosaminyltransferase SPINDLY n=1 Tax=Trapa incisa TaxID=236973 RepID=A0AAN7KF08_9MYRT|nr:hypothetical protein SAY87_003017 [Trapa incisa]KAK4767878.1 hypothetical protein SAY87_003019 [Trapa incisa]